MTGQVINLTISGSGDDSTTVFAWQVEPEGDYGWEVVGESAYQAALLALVGNELTDDGVEMRGKMAILVAESDNEHDENAVAVYIEGRKVGYLAADDAENFHGDLLEVSEEYGKPCAVAVCEAEIRGGFTKKDGTRAALGVFLDMEIPFI